MVRRIIAVFAPLLGVALTLASVFLLLEMTDKAESMAEPLRRNLAMLGTLFAGVLLLVGGVYISTRLMVLLVSSKDQADKPPEKLTDKSAGPAQQP